AHDAVEDHALGGCRLGKFVADDPKDDLVADQVTGLHHGARLDAERSAMLHRVAEQVTGRELGDAERLGEPGALGAFAATRWPEEEEVHAERSPYRGNRKALDP